MALGNAGTWRRSRTEVRATACYGVLRADAFPSVSSSRYRRATSGASSLSRSSSWLARARNRAASASSGDAADATAGRGSGGGADTVWGGPIGIKSGVSDRGADRERAAVGNEGSSGVAGSAGENRSGDNGKSPVPTWARTRKKSSVNDSGIAPIDESGQGKFPAQARKPESCASGLLKVVC